MIYKNCHLLTNELYNFETDLTNLVKNIKFRNQLDSFQKKADRNKTK